MISGRPPTGGSVAATIERLCTSNATHKRTPAGAHELTSGTAGPPSHAALAETALNEPARLTRESANAGASLPKRPCWTSRERRPRGVLVLLTRPAAGPDGADHRFALGDRQP